MGLKFYVNVKTEQYWIENSYHFSAFCIPMIYYFDKLSNYNTYERLSKCLSMKNAVKCDIYIDLFGSRQMPICISVFSFVCALLCQILKDDNAETKCRRVFLHISYNFLFIIFSDLNFNALDVLQAWALSKFHFNVIWPFFPGSIPY